MPIPVAVDERDAGGILSIQGRGCCGKDSQQLFMTKINWDVEIQKAKLSNNR
jgi:hypothetical protein